jgi:hypothetical protein
MNLSKPNDDDGLDSSTSSPLVPPNANHALLLHGNPNTPGRRVLAMNNKKNHDESLSKNHANDEDSIPNNDDSPRPNDDSPSLHDDSSSLIDDSTSLNDDSTTHMDDSPTHNDDSPDSPSKQDNVDSPYSVDRPPNQMDTEFFSTIDSIDDNNSSIQLLSYDALLQKKVGDIRLICNLCFYNFRNKANLKTQNKKVSCAGNKKTAVGRLVAFFYKLYLQRHGGATIGAPRPVENSSEFRDCETARLLDISVDPTFRATFELIHTGSNLRAGELDASNTNPTEDIWRGLVMKKYNDFEGYQPECRYPDDPTLNVFDPNSKEIRQRGPDILKAKYSSLRTEFTVCHSKWSASGQNNPERWPSFIEGRMYLLYFFKIMENDKVMMNMVLRKLPGTAALNSESLDTDALRNSTSRKPAPGSAGRRSTADDGVDAATARLVGAIENMSRGPQQTNLYSARRNLNREIMRLEDDIDDLEDVDDALMDEAQKKKRGRKRTRLAAQLAAEQVSLVYTESLVAAMEGTETRQDGGSTP